LPFIAIYAAIALPLFFIADWSALAQLAFTAHKTIALPHATPIIWLGMTVLFLLGLIDDFKRIRPYTKLVGQILVAALVTFLGFRLQWFTSLTVDTTITMLWLVGVINAFNLIDNMDGLCAGTALIGALAFAFLLTDNYLAITMVGLVTAGALAAFLFFNFNPASIFMGDAGSLVLGFILAMLGLGFTQFAAQDMIARIAVPVLVLMVPLFDTTLVTFVRILSGRKASMGGKDHTSHRLVLMGFSERTAVLLLYGISTLTATAAVFVSLSDTLTTPAVLIPLAIALILMGVYLAQLRVYPEGEFSRLKGQKFTPILIELTYKRQIALVLLDFFLVAFAYYLSYRLRFDSDDFSHYFKVFLNSLPAVIACKFIAFFGVGIYKGFWRFLSTADVWQYLKASLFGSLLAVVTVTYLFRFESFSKGIFIIDWILTTAMLLSVRASFRFFLDTIKRQSMEGANVLIYGAGRGGEILLRELLNNKQLRYKPLGFIDDDILKTGKKIQGYPILGTIADVGNLQARYALEGLLISFRQEGHGKIDHIGATCADHNLFLKKFKICLETVATTQDRTAEAGPDNPLAIAEKQDLDNEQLDG
jgi:UDP-GlcNAc:undecaprenyl-phosphate GlcNAc-1-phosphate transferase